MPQKKIGCACKHKCQKPTHHPPKNCSHPLKFSAPRLKGLVGKKPRTEAQTLALQKAREQAMMVRQQNAELKRKQQEIDRAVLAKAKRDERERIEREYDHLHSTPAKEAEVMEADEKPARKRKPARKVIVTEVSSGSDTEEEVQVVLPRAKKSMTAEQIRYQRAYSKMFDYR
jgi:hypothetical protein